MPIRAAFYVDGFNLYHAIDDLGQPHLKWLNLVALATHLIPKQTHELVRIVHCTAVRTDNPQRMIRHRAYLKALELVGVDCLKGHFAEDARDCHSCGSKWNAPVEKQGDVNVAISLIDDAHLDRFDHAYLVTSDTDQKATLSLFKLRFPHKKITVVTPPGRDNPKMFRDMGIPKLQVSLQDLERNLFPNAVVSPTSAQVRPPHYAPPAGWALQAPTPMSIQDLAAAAAAARAAAEKAAADLQAVVQQQGQAADPPSEQEP